MSFPPINLNVTSLSIEHLHIADVTVDKTELGNSFQNLYYLFVILFVCVILQTITIGVFVVHYRKNLLKDKRLPLLNGYLAQPLTDNT